jgi:hypothetical protein
MLRRRIEHPSEVGPPEIILPAARATNDINGLKAEITEARDRRRHIEGGMNGVTRTRVVQRKFEQRCGRKACTHPTKPDTRRG